MSLLTKRKSRWGIPPEELSALSSTLSRWTGLKADLKRLDPDAQAELAALVRQIQTEGGGYNLRDLDKKNRDRWELLTARSADVPDNFFETAREEASLRRNISELVARVRRPAPRVKYEQSGSITLPKAWCFDFLRGTEPVLWPAHIALLAWFEATWENGESLSPFARLEGSGDEQALVFDHLFGLLPASADPDGVFIAWQPLVAHLELNRFVAVDRSSREWRISRGTRSLKARQARNAP
jgi:hypothetical protein